jgi:hypothetical protein
VTAFGRRLPRISPEDLQRSGQGKSRVVTVTAGREDAVGAVAARSGADAVPFKVGEDQLYLAGRGLDLKGVQGAKAITYKGKVGTVNGEVLNRRNSFAEGFKAPGSIVALSAGLAGGASFGLVVAGIGSALGGATLGMFLVPTLTGAAIGFGVAMLGGLRSATKRVDLDLFSTVAK